MLSWKNDTKEEMFIDKDKPDIVETADIKETEDGESLPISDLNLETLNTKISELKLTQGEPKCEIQKKENQRPETVIMS